MADVIVVGGGNAGFCAAHAAARAGADVLLLEKAPADAAGGNSFYTAGAFRLTHGGLAALAPLLEDERLPRTELKPYTAADFRADLERVTDGRCDPVMADQLVRESDALPAWLAEVGIRWRLMYERQAYERDGRWTFWGGLALGTVDGGKGLIEQHTRAAAQEGVEVRYGAAVTDLAPGEVRVGGETLRGAVVLAAGGFEADPARRARHLGDGWEAALVRGTPTNTGEVLDAALSAGAAPHGDWSTCHSVAWDAGAPAQGGERRLTNQLTRQSYPLGIVVNARGERFVDEGADFRNYTYAKYGREILRQPGGRAFQLFDARTRPLLRPQEYDSEPITMAEAQTVASSRGRWTSTRKGSSALSASSTRRSPTRRSTRRSRTAGARGGRAAEVQLGARARAAAVLRLRRGLRDHVHVRRPARGCRRARARYATGARWTACSPPASSSAGCSPATTPAAPG